MLVASYVEWLMVSEKAIEKDFQVLKSLKIEMKVLTLILLDESLSTFTFETGGGGAGAFFFFLLSDIPSVEDDNDEVEPLKL